MVFRAQNGHIHEMSINPATGRWGQFDMTAATGAPSAYGIPVGYEAGGARVVFRATDTRVHEMSIDPATVSWRQVDLTVVTGAPNAKCTGLIN